ncbi:MAG: TIGR00282 family metallophosphoesterase [bacterium]|nr:TIGR00282 family metallophosphoesterase [bacterium]
MRVLAIGDVVGRTGRDALASRLQGIVDQRRIDLVIVNGENASGGWCLTPNIADEIFSMGAHIITSGNHIWDNGEIRDMLDGEPALLRPANYADELPGHGYYIHSHRGTKICVINLQGRAHMFSIDCPFRKFDEIYEKVKDEVSIIIVDFHAEATAEKKALGWYIDNRATLLYGTHTHVQTSDDTILPGGTGYITDIGMTGSFDSVIGMKKEQSIRKFLTQIRVKFEVAPGNPGINGIIAEVGDDGKTQAIERVDE